MHNLTSDLYKKKSYLPNGLYRQEHFDVVEQIHVTSRHEVTKSKWRELMRRFKTEKSYMSYQDQIEPDKDDQDEVVDFTDNNEDNVCLQNYLSIVGQWLSHSLNDSKRSLSLAICRH